MKSTPAKKGKKLRAPKKGNSKKHPANNIPTEEIVDGLTASLDKTLEGIDRAKDKWATTDLEYEVSPTRPERITYAASGLTMKQENFCLKYVETGNASAAYRHAYDASGMLPATVNKRASELLANGEITGRVDELKQAMLDRHHITRERVMREYARIGFFDIRQAFTEQGGLKPVSEMDEDTAAGIMAIEIDDNYEGYGDDRKHVGVTQKVKFHPKLPALDAMAKTLGIATHRVEVTGKNGKDLVPEVSDMEVARRVAFMLASAAAKMKQEKKNEQ